MTAIHARATLAAAPRGQAIPSLAHAAHAEPDGPDARLFEAIQERAALVLLRHQQLTRARRSPKQAYYAGWLGR